jgi:TonB family protein
VRLYRSSRIDGEKCLWYFFALRYSLLSDGYLIQLSGWRVKWQYWPGGLAVSVLLHLLVFWPAPDGKRELATAAPFSVRFVPVLALKSAPGSNEISECCAARSDESAASSIKEAGPQRIAVEMAREREVTTIRQRAGLATPAAGKKVMPTAGMSERIEDVTLESNDRPTSGVSLARYRLALAAAAIRMQEYPQAAMDAGQEGTVVLDVRLAAGSAAPLITVGRSSGTETLDREAVLLLTRAVMTVPAWHPTLGDVVSFRLPVSFELQGH